METVGLGCGLGQAKIAVGLSEVDFEGGPGFIYCWKFAPVSTGFWKHSSVENKRVGVADNLIGGVGIVPGIGIVHSILELRVECFDWLGGIVGGLEADVGLG